MSKPGEKQEWFQVAEAFEASGLTQKAFSAQRGVRLSTLQSWVYRRRRQRARKAPAVRRNRPASDVAGGIAGVAVVVDPGRNVEAG
ncbi:IS66 family insertion sequence element accessory protein TnpA [Myxococcus stipitatus]|uniref:IS66 family insertion sequence element accessory protein TnpA n=1 Tax=Myxococcus stipitatus TaxID=83455 RepID=UPI003AF2A38C